MAFDLVPCKHFTNLDLAEPPNEVPQVHFGEYGLGPAVKVSETENTIIVEAEMPGISTKDLDFSINGELLTIDVSINGDLLTVRREKEQARETEDGDCYCSEMILGKFSRSVRLPAEAKQDSTIIASYKNGVIRLEIPKAKKEPIQ